MKDSMQLGLENQRGEVLDQTLRSIQSFMKTELRRSAFLKLRTGITLMQAATRGAQGREAYEQQKEVADVENALKSGIEGRNKNSLETALTRANGISYSGPLVKEAKKNYS